MTDYTKDYESTKDKLDKAIALRDKRINKAESLKNVLESKGIDTNRRYYANELPWEDLALTWDYESVVESINDTNKKIKDLEDKLHKYETKIEVEKAKESSLSNVPNVIIEFMNQWEQRAFNYYYDSVIKFKNEKRELTGDAYKQLIKNTPVIVRNLAGYYDWEDRLKKTLKDEKRSKILSLMNKVVYYTGEIKDASFLSISNSGELNGCIIGERGRVEVETIGAGGYNIQCFHYRTLIKPLI